LEGVVVVEDIPFQSERDHEHARDAEDSTDDCTQQNEVQPSLDDPDLDCLACTAAESTYVASAREHAVHAFTRNSGYAGLEVDVFLRCMAYEIGSQKEKRKPKAVIAPRFG
jgi:hypothetical protein